MDFREDIRMFIIFVPFLIKDIRHDNFHQIRILSYSDDINTDSLLVY